MVAGWVDRGMGPADPGRDLEWEVAEDRAGEEPAAVELVPVAVVQVCGIREAVRGVVVAQGQAAVVVEVGLEVPAAVLAVVAVPEQVPRGAGLGGLDRVARCRFELFLESWLAHVVLPPSVAA